jgi:hypothetical protein
MIAALVAAAALVAVGRWARAEEVRPVADVVAEATASPAADPVVEAPAEIPAAVAVPEPTPEASAVALEDGKLVLDLPLWWAGAMNAIEALAEWGWRLAFTFLGAYLIKRIKDTKVANDLTAALESGVNVSWQTVGKAWKAAHADGKFTDEEKDRLRTTALNAAKEVATGPVLKALKVLGRQYLDAKISGIVEKRKAVARKP